MQSGMIIRLWAGFHLIWDLKERILYVKVLSREAGAAGAL